MAMWFWAAFASVQIHKTYLAKGNKTLKWVSISLNCISPKICKISNMIGKLTILFFGFCWFMLTASELLFNVIWVILSCTLSFVDGFWGWRCHKILTSNVTRFYQMTDKSSPKQSWIGYTTSVFSSYACLLVYIYWLYRGEFRVIE